MNEPPLSKIGVKVTPRFSVFHKPPKALATYQTLGFFGSISMSCTRPVVRVGPMLRNSKPFRALAVRPAGSCAPMRAADAAAAASATDKIRRFMRTSPRKSRNSLTPGRKLGLCPPEPAKRAKPPGGRASCVEQVVPLTRLLDASRKFLTGRPLLLSTMVAILAISAIFTASVAAWMSYDLTAGLPKRDAINGLGDMAQSTTVFDARDRHAFTIFKEQRIELPLEKMSPNFLKAVISVEDQRFYQHSGVDAIRTVGAVVRNLEAGRRAEGGSTITQQLARLSFLTRGKTYRRKLKEIVLASYIESEYSKNDILQMYLNKAYFGDGLYGVEAAARGYFGKSASDLTVDEAALLAGLIQSPSAYAPTGNLDRAVARRAVVLQTMVNSGAIDAPTAERAKKMPVKLVNGLEVNESSGQYFKEAVRRELVDRFGWPRVSQGGLRVFTTLDIDLQRSAEALVEKNLKDIEGRRGFTHAPRAKLPRVKEGETARLPAGGAHRHGSDQRIRARAGRRPRLHREPVQSPPPGEAAVRIGVQAVRLRRGARGRVHAGDADHAVERSAARERRGVAAGGRAQRPPTR